MRPDVRNTEILVVGKKKEEEIHLTELITITKLYASFDRT